MKKLSASQLGKTKRTRVSLVEDVLIELRAMKVGDAILLEKEDWKVKSPPVVYIGGYFRKGRSGLRFSVKGAVGKDSQYIGWTVQRIA